MTAAGVPLNETDRIAALSAYAILDTPPEPMFDDVVAIASAICDAPIATITLIDRTRQWFKARVGMTVSQTPREHSFCAHAILTPDLLIVPDATLDPRFADNPAVLGDPHIRFYAGAPLAVTGGHRLGTLCVIDREPRQLTAVQVSALNALSRQVVALLELRRTGSELSGALSRVRILEGFIPICAHCKKVRDDQDYWQQVESYMQDRSSAQFSHGICPDCARLYWSDEA